MSRQCQALYDFWIETHLRVYIKVDRVMIIRM
jgi:hypothetical protein